MRRGDVADVRDAGVAVPTLRCDDGRGHAPASRRQLPHAVWRVSDNRNAVIGEDQKREEVAGRVPQELPHVAGCLLALCERVEVRTASNRRNDRLFAPPYPHVYKPAALRSASLIRSCQSGPSSWKCARRSLSSLSDTCSFEIGMPARFFRDDRLSRLRRRRFEHGFSDGQGIGWSNTIWRSAHKNTSVQPSMRYSLTVRP